MSCDSSIHLSFPSCEFSTNYDNIAKVLLIGDTGAGKSTFINYLFNYFNHGDLDHLKVAIPCKYHSYPTGEYSHNELNIHDTTQSKTNACTQYLFTDSTTQKQYLFLDTPGLSDTRGTEQSEINMNKIIEAIAQLGNLTTVIIVVNGSISRLTTCLRSIITTLNGNLPDIILENVLVILTNAKKYESPFDLQILNLHGKVYPFYMQNNAFVSDPQTWKKLIHNELQIDWEYSMQQIQLILQTLDSFKQISINAFLQMQQIRNDIKSIIHQARLELIQIQKIQNELCHLDSALQRADRDVQIYQDHTRVHTLEKIELIDAPYHSTLCANCNEVCHNNCRLNETRFLGAQIFSQCLVMNNNGSCQQCRNHCSYIDHYHAKKTIQITYETLHDLLIDLKNKYDQACENRRNYQEKIFTTSETKELLEKTLKQKINQLKTKSNDLCRICSSFNLAHELKCLIKQLKIEEDLFENLETKTLSEQLIRSLTKFTRLFEEHQEKNRRKRPAMQIIFKDSSIETKPTDITALKTSELIELHKTNDHTRLDSILEELYRRVQGKSTGPLSTPNEIVIIHKFLDKYKQKGILDLSYTSRKLQKQINDILKSNIFRISDVNPDLLIENFIVQSLLDDKEKTDDTPQNFYLLETAAAGSLSRSMNRSHSTPLYPLPYPVDEVPLFSSGSPNKNSCPIGISHILTAPYPSADTPSPLPALPSDSPTFQRRKSQSSQPIFRLEDYADGSISVQSARSSIDYRDSMPMPTPTNNQQSSTPSSGFFRRKSIESQHTMPSIGRSSIPDIFSFNIDSPQDHRHQLTADLDYEKFRSLDNSQLLSMYTDVNTQQHEVRKAAVHQELERRCYGDHPILLDERRNFFEERMKMNERKTIGELLIIQATIKQKIRAYLKNDDVTLINNIPVELIIEANVLNQLILSKR